jgi:hypothetical protein
MRLARYVPPAMRSELYLVIGEAHHPKRPQPAATPQWLIVPERGLLTGIAIFGAVGSGKTSGCIYPFAEQVLAYPAEDAESRVAGLVLEVNGDFCHKVRGILKKHETQRCTHHKAHQISALEHASRLDPPFSTPILFASRLRLLSRTLPSLLPLWFRLRR